MRDFTISTGSSRFATQWPRMTISWDDFIERLRHPVKGRETLSEYKAMTKSEQAVLKDTGGFVAGTIKEDGRRKAGCIEARGMVTLDLDNIEKNGTAAVMDQIDGLGVAALAYSTRKHSPTQPRLRVVIPLDRDATPDEYEPVARKLAEMLGIERCDQTTFEAHRLMYWPSVCSDVDYVLRVFNHSALASVDAILRMYSDWHDVSSWPALPGEAALIRGMITRQSDPEGKEGIVGQFCRTYDIPGAMEAFLPGVYGPTDKEDRYTYIGGSTAGGAVLYEGGKFLYSHHSTDPCSKRLVNAFDLVRVHKFGHLDDEAKQGTPAGRMPSYLAMAELARADEKVAALISEEQAAELAERRKAFGIPENEAPAEDSENEDPGSPWESQLTRTQKGVIERTVSNICTILENDPGLKGAIALDEFKACSSVIGPLPWDPEPEGRRWSDTDESNLIRYLEDVYGFRNIPIKDIQAALNIVGPANRINVVQEYLKSLTWDNVPRCGGLLIDYLGAEDTKFVRTATIKILCAAVQRACCREPVKFDDMLILIGDQGIGKSTLLSILGGEWFSDSLVTFEGKDAAEVIQGTWINELGELTAMSRSEHNAVKQFLSKKSDIYRAAYARNSSEYVRRCVFFGTSNDYEFLRDPTGNRRFWPIDVGVTPPTKSVWNDLPGERDQIWAEAYVRAMTLATPLHLDKEMEAEALKLQRAHFQQTGKEGLVEAFLAIPIPENWYRDMDDNQRRLWLGNMSSEKQPDVPCRLREKVHPLEIWMYALNGSAANFRDRERAEVTRIMANISGWEKAKNQQRFGDFGRIRGYKTVSQ